MTHHQLIRYRKISRYVLILPIISLLTGLMIACSQGSLATKSVQATRQAPITDEIFTVVEVQPEFTGGMARFTEYIHKNLRYPQEAIKAKAEGRVFVSLIILKDGSIQDVTVLKGRGHGMNEEAVRLVQSMPNWIPGRQSGRAVNVKYNVVIPFTLADAK